MKIEIKITKEHEDGSADAKISFDKLGMQTLIQWGMVAMLENAIDKYATEKQMAEIKPTKKKKKSKEIDLDGRC